VDLGPGGRGQLRAGADGRAGQRRADPPDPQAAGQQLEARQALDHQPGPRGRAKKRARDRLIRLTASHPDWVLGFEDEVWWSRLAAPARHAWAESDRPLRLVEQAVATDDPDPKALACYGRLVRWVEHDGWHEEAWLRFVDGRPVSALTTQDLAWCCAKLAAAGKRALRLVWDNAGWHVSHPVRSWIRDHNRRVKQTGTGVRMVSCYLPTKSPWLTPIEPKWLHGKRRVAEPARLLSADELIRRVCAAFDCPHDDHLAIPQQVA
jgi:DDE superfamily endonuclease